MKRPYVAGFVLVSLIMAVANTLHFSRQVTCADCFFPYGVPFTIYHEGGFAGGAGFNTIGIVADVAILVIASFALGAVLKTARPRCLRN
jgi:hypothetical protein